MPSKKRPYVDETFEIEEILSHKPQAKRTSGYIEYKVKWKGYDEDENSFEDSWQFEALGLVLNYWNELYQKDNNVLSYEIANWHRILHEWQKDQIFHRTDDWFTINQSKELIAKYDWSWLLRNFEKSDDFPEIGELFRRYEEQVNKIASVYETCPFIEVCYHEDDDALPIPWKQLLFDIEKPDHSVAVKESIDDYGLVLSLNESVRELMRHREHLHEEGRIKARVPKLRNKNISGMDLEVGQASTDWVFPSSKVCLLLMRTVDRHWELQSGHEAIEKNTIIMPLTGELVDVSVADECMRTEGEVVAMSGFLQLTDEFSLDRRFRSGFDRFIQHSCDPNCFVEVSFWKGKPVAMVKAKKRIPKMEPLTLDFFHGFSISGSDPHKLFGKRSDHIICACAAKRCREYLWVETTKSGAAPKSKAERLKQHKRPFYGLRVVKIKPRQVKLEDQVKLEEIDDNY